MTGVGTRHPTAAVGLINYRDLVSFCLTTRYPVDVLCRDVRQHEQLTISDSKRLCMTIRWLGKTRACRQHRLNYQDNTFLSTVEP